MGRQMCQNTHSVAIYMYKIKHLYVCHIRDIGTVDDVTRGPKAQG